MKTEMLPYQKLEYVARSYGKLKNNNLLSTLMTQKAWLILPAAFFTGRTSILGGLMPFGIAFYCASYSIRINKLLLALAVILGILTTGAMGKAAVTIAAIVIFSIVHIPFKRYKEKQGLAFSLAAGISALLPEIVNVYLQGFLLFDFIKVIFSSAIIFLLVFIFSNAMSTISDTSQRYSFTNEQRISIAILSAVVLSGLGNISFFTLGIKNTLCILVILIFSYKCGPGVGSAIGVTVGLIISMSVPATPLIISSYAFCGLLAGVLRSLGKTGSALGFILGNAVLTLYLNGSTDVLIYLKEIIAAVALFMIMPARFVGIIAGGFGTAGVSETEDMGCRFRIKDITVNKLNKFSKAFMEMSKTFSEISETTAVADKQDITSLFDSVADKVCKDCSLSVYCWDRNFYATYQVMFKIVDKLDSKGRIDENDIPEYFTSRCERVYDFVKSVNSVYEVFKVNMVWRSKLGESRGMVSQQLEGLSRVISNLASDINTDINFKDDLQDAIQGQLVQVGIKNARVTVVETQSGKYDIAVSHAGCGGKRSCVSSIERVVSSAVGRKMVKEGSECFYNAKSGGCRLRLIEEEAFCVTTGVARLPKQNETVSGDSYTFMNTGEGKYIAALSDGMGSGYKAAMQSKATVNLIEHFMESGIDKDTTVKLINSLLVMKSTDDSFATIDMSLIDLYTGEVEFVKIGAVPTLIKRGEGLQTIKTASLPAGILSNLELELKHEKIQSGDFIIMMSDGIIDAFKKTVEDEETLQDFIIKINSINPQEIADLILDKAYRNGGSTAGDDMLVVVSKVWKRVK